MSKISNDSLDFNSSEENINHIYDDSDNDTVNDIEANNGNRSHDHTNDSSLTAHDIPEDETIFGVSDYKLKDKNVSALSSALASSSPSDNIRIDAIYNDITDIDGDSRISTLHDHIKSIHSMEDSSEIMKKKNDFFCYICYDNVPLKPSKSVTTLQCGHKYCKSCFTGYIRSKVIDGQITLSCFHPKEIEQNVADIPSDINPPTCSYLITSKEIKSALSHDEDTLKKYNRFSSLKGNTFMRECCYCNHIQLGNPEKPMITCNHCQRVYCYYHANAHTPDETCEQYEAKNEEIQKTSIDFISKYSKKCPKCGVAIWKIDGCNHMKCTVCNQAFCWICGKIIEDTVLPAHFQWWNPSGCSNMQMNDAAEPSYWTRTSARLLTWIELIILGPLTVISTVGAFILCSCCVPHYLMNQDESTDPMWIKFQRLGSNCMSGWGIFWIAVVFFLPAAFIFLGLVIGFGSAAFAMIYPVYAIYRLCNREYPWPDSVTRFFKTCFQRTFSICRATWQFCCCFHITIRQSPSTDTNRSFGSTGGVNTIRIPSRSPSSATTRSPSARMSPTRLSSNSNKPTTVTTTTATVLATRPASSTKSTSRHPHENV